MDASEFNAFEFRLLNEFQRDFPLVPAPFRELAATLNSGESAVLKTLRRLQNKRALSRVGPVFRPNVFGASTLAAMAVPAERLEAVAAVVNACPEVNHNYQREHDFNLWFVVTGKNEARVQAVLAELTESTGLAVLDLPLLTSYHIDLGFRLDRSEQPRHPDATAVPALVLTPDEQRLIAALQDGLPLIERPYAAIAAASGWTEQDVIDRLGAWLEGGQLRRLGVVVRHHELGYRANGMAVWDISDDRVDEIGARFADYPFVTLCYRRPRRLPAWRYNLFCMIHGRDRAKVEAQHRQLIADSGLEDVAAALLFSTRRFKQRGARYFPAPAGRRGN